jgi:hypothetical protein
MACAVSVMKSENIEISSYVAKYQRILKMLAA